MLQNIYFQEVGRDESKLHTGKRNVVTFSKLHFSVRWMWETSHVGEGLGMLDRPMHTMLLSQSLPLAKKKEPLEWIIFFTTHW